MVTQEPLAFSKGGNSQDIKPAVEAKKTSAAPATLLKLVKNDETGTDTPVPKDVRVIPAEHVALFAVDLPFRNPRLHLQAVGFAIEDKIGSPLENPHVAVGPRLPHRRFLVAALDHSKMPTDAPGPVIAEQMLLPGPKTPEGQPRWNVLRRGGRFLVRTSDGTGFAASDDQIVILWEAFGRPAIDTFTDTLPKKLATTATRATPPKPDKRDLKFDLRQGIHSQSPNILRRSALSLAGVLVFAGLAQGALFAHQTRQLENSANQSNAAVADQLSRMALTLPIHAQSLAPLDRLIARAATPADDPFLTLMGRTSRGLSEMPQQITVTALDYAATTGILSLQVQGGSIDALRLAGQHLEEAGLRFQTGAMSATETGAETTFVLQGGPDGT